MEYEVRLSEDEFERDESGRITHHPINSRYYRIPGQDVDSHGHLTFAGHDLDKSPLLNDIRVYYLAFLSESPVDPDRDAWADPLRAKVLERLSGQDRSWYMSFVGDIPAQTDAKEILAIDEDIRQVLPETVAVNSVSVRSEQLHYRKSRFMKRHFFEIPIDFVSLVVGRYWPRSYPGYPIEGYCMQSGKINLIRKWDRRKRDDRLFRDVMDEVLVAFYTFPAEHRYFVFLTNKLNLTELGERIGFESLKAEAKAMAMDE